MIESYFDAKQCNTFFLFLSDTMYIEQDQKSIDLALETNKETKAKEK